MEEELTPAAEQAATTTDEPNLTDTETDTDTDAESEEAPPRHSFESMNLDSAIHKALDEMGYDEPTDVQHAVWEDIMAGRDIMVQARTGTGKTAAFGIPIVQKLSADEPGVQALILAPTRELALQVSLELSNIGRHKGIKVVPVYGGAPMGKQIDALKAGAQVVAGTPGRVLDHIGRGTLKTTGVRLLVLDECDEMLSMGFQEEIERIISTLPPREERQNMLFSATIPSDIERIARRHMTDPHTIALSSDDDISVEHIDHSYYVVSGMARTRDLMKVLEVEQPTAAIIFCNTREDTNTVASYLQKHGLDAEAISSDLSQNDRERVMKRMRDKNLHYLVATDVAARGIDINDLSHVINYAFPESPEVYVHRTGRTGRAGNKGTAISLVGPREIGSFYYLKLLYKIRPRERMLPSAAEISSLREGQRYEAVLERVPQEPKAEYRALARRLWQSTEGERVVGALLQDLLEAPAGRPAAEKAATRPTERIEAEPEAKPERREERSSRRGDRDRDRDRGRGRDRDEPRRRRRRSRDDEAQADEARTDAPAAPPETADETRAGDEERPRKKRRRRRGSRSESSEPRASRGDDETREFWEAWADEKTTKMGKVTVDDDDDGNGNGDGEEDDDAVRLYVNLGRREEITADDLRGLLGEALSEEESTRLGKVQVRNTHCYIRVPTDLADKVIEGAQGKSYKDRDVQVERAKR